MLRAEAQMLCAQVVHLPSVGNTLVDFRAQSTLKITQTTRTVAGASQCQVATLSRWWFLTSTHRGATTIWGFTTGLLLQVRCWWNSVVTWIPPAESYRRAPRSGSTFARMHGIHGEDSRRSSQQWTGHSRVSVPTWIRSQWSSHYGRITRAILTLSTNKYIQKVQYPPRYTWTSAQPTHRKTAVRNNCSDGKSNYWIPLKFVHPSRLSQGKINFYALASNLRHIKDAGFTTMHRQHSELCESEGGVWGWNADCVTTSK